MKRSTVLAGIGVMVAAVMAGRSLGQTRPTNDPATDSAKIQKLVAALNSDDPDDREKAETSIGDLPFRDLPQLKALAAKDHFSDAQLRLNRLIARLQARAGLAARKRIESKAVFEWTGKTALTSYTSGTHQNPKWDKLAKQGLTKAWLRGVTMDATERAADSDEAAKQLQAALDAGCDDPAVLASAGLVFSDHGRSPATVISLFAQAAEHLNDPALDPSFHCIICGRMLRAYAAGYHGGTKANSKGMLNLINDMGMSIQKMELTPGVPMVLLVEDSELVMACIGAVHGPPDLMYQNLYPELEKIAPNDERVLRFKGSCYIDMAWQARGSGYSNTVTPQGFKDFSERLVIANEALTKAWQLDPTDPIPPTKMLTVELGQGKGRDVMELWFKRAMDADPDNYEACGRKEMYLEPKWYGSPEEMLKFGHECLDGGNWRTDIPYELINIQNELAGMTTDRAAYLQQDSVWTDFAAVYSGYLRRRPGNNVLRTSYALAACNAGRWAVANEQFNKLGDKVDVEQFGSENIMQRYRNKAKQEAAAK